MPVGVDRSQIHVDVPLSMLAIAFMLDDDDFVATKVFPSLPVEKSSNKYFTYPIETFMRSESEPRGYGRPAVEIDFNLSTDEYQCDGPAVQVVLDKRTMKDWDKEAGSLPEVAAKLVVSDIKQNMEREFLANFFVTGAWTNQVTIGSSAKWNDDAVNPLSAMRTGIQTMKSTTGMIPNEMTLGFNVWLALQDNDELIDRIKHTGRDSLTTEILSGLLSVDMGQRINVRVAGAVGDKTDEGVDASIGFLHGDNALLTYSTPTPSPFMATAGYTFMWDWFENGLMGGEQISVDTFYDQNRKSDIVRGESSWDMKQISDPLGYMMLACI